MSKIHFFYGTVNSAKSTQLLVKAHYLESIGKRILCIKPAEDTRDINYIKSRTGLEKPCITIDEFIKISNSMPLDIEILFIDEVQFISTDKLKYIIQYAIAHNIEIFSYGLRTDINKNLFPASKIMFAHATNIEEIKNYCMKCGKHKAIYNVRFNAQGEIDTSLPIIQPGFSYAGYCNLCYE